MPTAEHNWYERIKSGEVRVSRESPHLLRFWRDIDKEGPEHPTLGKCWVWISTMISQGYGQLCVNYRMIRAHRYSWELHNGRIQNNLLVLHKCDNRKCVNPSHLFLGTNQDNEDDKVSKERQARGESYGRHVLTEKQVRYVRYWYIRESKTRGQSALARELHVHPDTISKIIWRETWKHI